MLKSSKLSFTPTVKSLPALGRLHLGQFQFGHIPKWINIKNVRHEFGNITLVENFKWVIMPWEFVTERFFLTYMYYVEQDID